ncbi:MAG: LysR family transcriptional regulator [Pseudomonadota bacterium]
MDKIAQMRAFIAVAAQGSFTAAAARLDTTPQLVSKYVKALEEDLSARLLNRTTRSVNPTETGRAFYLRAVRLIEEYDELRATVRDEHAAPRGLLKLTAPTTFGELHVVPIVAAFLEAHGDMRVDLHLTDRFVGMIDEGFDLAIRIGALDSSGMIARRLAETPIRLCASPAYLEAAGVPRAPQDLAAHRCVVDANFRDQDVWRFRTATQKVEARFRVNSATAVRQLVLAGAGLALCPAYVVQRDIDAGRLASLLEDEITMTLGVYAVYLEPRHLSGKIRAFIDFAASRLNL